MDKDTLSELARHQAWADAQHWKSLHGNPALKDDAEIRTRLNHMVRACRGLTALARGESVDFGSLKDSPQESTDAIEGMMRQANADLSAAVDSVELDRSVQLPRGPNGPFQAPAGVLLLQAITHGMHHRGQNAARMRTLGVTPPMTDYVMWYAIGRPHS